MMIVRELTGGLYFGRRERFYDEPAAGVNGVPGQRAYDTLEYSRVRDRAYRPPGLRNRPQAPQAR